MDENGFSAFYYAIRPDIFQRIFRFLPEEEELDSKYAPFILRKIEIILTLLHFEFTTQTREPDPPNRLHPVALLGSSEVLGALLELDECRKFVNAVSVFGGTPLHDAIVRGNRTSFELLLSYGSDRLLVSPSENYHALHICAMFPGDVVLEFASRLIADDPTSVHRLDHHGWTPLHLAAQYGHESLANYLVDKGSSLLVFNDSGLSPLGMAIRARFLALIRLLCRKHKIKGQSQIASGHVLFRNFSKFLRSPLRGGSNILLKQVHALEFILRPGRFSPGSTLSYMGPHNSILFPPKEVSHDRGCAGIPFSKLSLKTLDILLEEYRTQTWSSIFQPFNFVLHIFRDHYIFESGLYWAMRMAIMMLYKR